MTFGKFSLRLAAFSLLVAVLIQVLLMKTTLLIPAIWGAYAFFVVLTLVLYYISTFSLKMSVKNSMSIIFGAMGFRLFASLIYIVAYTLYTGEKDIPFTISFMLLFLLFQVFEIYHIVANLRPDSKKS
ncbi:MAG: hypothetical protein EP332_01235 [Bacteroidetes bacterium]|nr:MAG: hypothetical protein EP332_01235 [Bacteroidota bacterium]